MFRTQTQIARHTGLSFRISSNIKQSTPESELTHTTDKKYLRHCRTVRPYIKRQPYANSIGSVEHYELWLSWQA